MDHMGDCDQKKLMEEISKGRELARQLHCHLSSPSSSLETRDLLLQQIMDSFEKAIAMLNSNNPTPAKPAGGSSGSRILPESPLSLSEESEENENSNNNGVFKKRKSMQKWTEQVRVSPGTGLEGALDDGFSWRKYGQKDILGAKHPRGYYRCTHRHSKGCLATKRVQRSDSDPTILEITYTGSHSCSQSSRSMPNQERPRIAPMQPQNNQQDLLSSFQTGLRVVTENLESHHNQVNSCSPLFQFPSLATESQMFSSSSMNVSSSFNSPATSGTDYFPISPAGIHGFAGNDNGNGNGNPILHGLDSELNGILSAATSATNSPTFGIGFPFDDQTFTFDNSGFLS